MWCIWILDFILQLSLNITVSNLHEMQENRIISYVINLTYMSDWYLNIALCLLNFMIDP